MKFVSTSTVKALAISGSMAMVSAWAQPTPAPTTGDLKCTEEANVVGTDTVASVPDADGYLNLFDGTFKGWFQSCKTGHSAENRAQGAIFRIGTADGKPAVYSTQRGTSGGIMMTNKKFTNYEIVIDFWPDYGNDGGLFNRTPIDGICFQTVMDYISSGSVGGTWGEGGYPSRDFRPWKYNSETSLEISGDYSWTTTTQKLKATTEKDIPCASTGCTQADYLSLWDTDGWMMLKVQFYGGLTTASNVHMKSWFKKPAAKVWVPIIQDTTLNHATPAGYLGLQVHHGGRFGGPRGTWYRGVKWRPLDDKGVVLPGYTGGTTGNVVPPQGGHAPAFKFTASAAAITGMIDTDYSITVQDVFGRTLETFSGKAGAVQHPFTTSARGVLFLNLKTAFGIQTARVVRTTL